MDWRVDFVLSSSALQSAQVPVVQLRLAVQAPNGPTAVHAFEVEDSKFSVLLSGTCPGHVRRFSITIKNNSRG